MPRGKQVVATKYIDHRRIHPIPEGSTSCTRLTRVLWRVKRGLVRLELYHQLGLLRRSSLPAVSLS